MKEEKNNQNEEENYIAEEKPSVIDNVMANLAEGAPKLIKFGLTFGGVLVIFFFAFNRLVI